jgi:AcrR family transcriptional regulator
LTNKEKLLKIATHLFAQKGYSATSIDEIATACGVTKAAIYYHFKDKAALYEEIFTAQVRTLAHRIEEGVAQHDSPTEQLGCYIDMMAQELGSNVALCALLMRELSNGGSDMPLSTLKEMLRTFKVLQHIITETPALQHCKEPMLLQMMILGTLSFFLQTRSLRQRVVSEIDASLPMDAHYSHEEATQKLKEMIFASMGIA